MTSRIRVPVKTVENRGNTVWLVGVNREEAVKEPYTAHLQVGAIACRPFHADVGPSGLSIGIRIAIPSATEPSWSAHKFQDFLRLSQGSAHYFRIPLRENPKSRQLSREEVEHD